MKRTLLIEARSITKVFERRKVDQFRALDEADLWLEPAEILGLVGESGSGKTTLGRILVGLLQPDHGEVCLDGVRLLDGRKHVERRVRRELSMIFQDPYESLNPAKNVFDIVSLPLRANGVKDKTKLRAAIHDALREVRLMPPEDFEPKYPHQLSGGQRQRVAFAKALILKPRFLVADEPTSMLDASLGAEMLKLLSGANKKYGMAVLFITHDLSAAAQICTRILIMCEGRIVERGQVWEIIRNPKHPYTKALVSTIPQICGQFALPSLQTREGLSSKSGCHFYPRCPRRFERCSLSDPPEFKSDGRSVKCFLYDSNDGSRPT